MLLVRSRRRKIVEEEDRVQGRTWVKRQEIERQRDDGVL